LCLCIGLPAHAGKRVALVIGNAAYQHAGELANTRNDAGDMAAALRMHGFEVLDGIDLDKAALEQNPGFRRCARRRGRRRVLLCGARSADIGHQLPGPD